MTKILIPFKQIKQLAHTDVAYATGDARLRDFYQYEANMSAFEAAKDNRAKRTYPRADLVTVLEEQYAGLPEKPEVLGNIAALADEYCFTIVTAHQPSLFLGPLYFLYKALTTIVLAEKAQEQSGGKHCIVPVFVLGSEDHDLEELNAINLFGKKLVWPSEETGAVGSMSTESLAPVLDTLKGILGESEPAQRVFARVQAAYQGQPSIAGATRAMLHDLFGRFGLLVLDMNHPLLKRHFAPIILQELLERPSVNIVNNTMAQLNALGFKAQAPPREINLFYLVKGLRERIVWEENLYKVLNTNVVFTENEIREEVAAHPERFSPNVVLRPLYQEMLLPNLAYVGGGGELAYWLERRELFRHFEVEFPMLVRRHSVMWLDQDIQKKLAKFDFTAAEFFEDTDALTRMFIEKNAATEISLASEINQLSRLYDNIAQKATMTDPSLESAVRADKVKALSALEQWEGRLRRAEKQKHEVTLNQIRAAKEKLFPAGGLQERFDNFMPYLLKYGDAFLDTLKANFEPFDAGFVVIEAA